MYSILRSILFMFDAEKVHYFSMRFLKIICKINFIKKIISSFCSPKNTSSIHLFNIKFKNKIGLAAGFDKNAAYLNELQALGFGHVEIGTVTPLPQKGNDKPRLFRLPKDKALINRMGFNNQGVNAVAERLSAWKNKSNQKLEKLIIGGNIGKNKITPNEMAWLDYEICFKALHPFVDYFVVNVSSPNTPGLRELQEKKSLEKILTNLQNLNVKENKKPILLKIAPDLNQAQLNDVVDLALEIKLDGLVVANTSLDRSNLSETSKKMGDSIGTGGLSGLPIKEKATQMIQFIHTKTKGSIPIIASGGIFTAVDAQQKINAGASLVQVWTGFVYQGPTIVKKICAT